MKGSHEEGKQSEKFEMSIEVDGKKLKLNPNVVDTLGNVIEALQTGLKDLPKDGEKLPKKVFLDKKGTEKNPLIFKIGDNLIKMNKFTRCMIRQTLLGFLSTLEGMPDEVKNAQIDIKYSPK